MKFNSKFIRVIWMMKNDIIYLMKLRELKDKLIYAINNDLNNEENYKSAKDIYEELKFN